MEILRPCPLSVEWPPGPPWTGHSIDTERQKYWLVNTSITVSLYEIYPRSYNKKNLFSMFKVRVHFGTFFADSDAEYVVVT